MAMGGGGAVLAKVFQSSKSSNPVQESPPFLAARRLCVRFVRLSLLDARPVIRYTQCAMNRTLPVWLTKRVPHPETVREVEGMMRDARLHTVCESARCPNLGEGWSKKNATFMILGDICTRACGFCNIKVGKPLELDVEEPMRVAETARAMGLKHIVVTSVARDELPDEGAGQFAATIRSLRQEIPNAIVEVLTPDFKCKRWCIT